jgi:MFS transporter, ACS family, tartrate transporter
MERTIEQRAMRKVYWRILPFTGLLYFICYLDRVNVGFAALTMRGDLGLSQAQFGLGAGTAFFLGYFILEVPEWDVPLRPAQGRSYSQRAIQRLAMTKEAMAREYLPLVTSSMRNYVASAGAEGQVVFDLRGVTEEQWKAVKALQIETRPVAGADGSPASEVLKIKLWLHDRLLLAD